MHLTHSHHKHYAPLLTCIEHIQWKILEACVNVCWVYSVESVFTILLVHKVTFLVFLAMCSRGYIHYSPYYHQIGCIKLLNCYIFRGCVLDMASYAVDFIYILEKLDFVGGGGGDVCCFVFYCAVLLCPQIIVYIMARRSYCFVCILHYLIMMQTYLKVLKL